MTLYNYINDNSKKLVEYTMKNSSVPVIADADALNIIADNLELFNYRKENR